MAISKKIQYAELDELRLDPKNPRLGRGNSGDDVTQERVLELMSSWTLEELAVSFLESGFWPQEALVVVNEELYGAPHLVVVEGNRRLAALIYLRDAISGRAASRKWAELAASAPAQTSLLTEIPYLRADSRQELQAFLGFRHVTGIKEWNPAEKAEYIAKLIEEQNMTYQQVMRKIGSKTPTVRQNYISYRLLLQMEDQEGISIQNVEDKFSVLFLSLRTSGVQKYLQIDIRAEPKEARLPVPQDRLEGLKNFALWLFGSEERPPLFTDSRLVDDFGVILDSPDAVAYLERADRPSFEVAFRMAGGDEPELVRLVDKAADNVELALSRAHLHRDSERLQSAVKRLSADARQLLRIFPAVKSQVEKEDEQAC
ncbi:MAG: hypothetical protein FJ291_18155 [Planctomycetes bacterium]|nr:hypothetical protein [Planctomycetota bacterium]